MTVLECMIGLIALSLVVVGLARMGVMTEKLVASMETWCDRTPTWYLVPRAERYERVLGCPADLSQDGSTQAASPPGEAYRVEVLSVVRSLDGPSAGALVQLEALEP